MFQSDPCLEDISLNRSVLMQPHSHLVIPGSIASSFNVNVNAAWFVLGDHAKQIQNYKPVVTVHTLLAPNSFIITLLTFVISMSCEKSLWVLLDTKLHLYIVIILGCPILKIPSSNNYFINKG